MLMHDKDAFTLTGTYWGRAKPEGKITFQYRDSNKGLALDGVFSSILPSQPGESL